MNCALGECSAQEPSIPAKVPDVIAAVLSTVWRINDCCFIFYSDYQLHKKLGVWRRNSNAHQSGRAFS